MAIIDLIGKSCDEFNPLEVKVSPLGYPQTARFTIIADAPGLTDAANKRPFTGMSGQTFDRLLTSVNIPKHQCYITYFCKTPLAKGNITSLWDKKSGWLHGKFDTLRENIFKEIDSCNARVVLLMGELSIKAVLNFDDGLKRRGSIYERKGKYIIPMLDPARALPRSEPSSFYTMLIDFKKAMRIEQEGFQELPIKTYIRPTFQEACDFLNRVLQQDETSYDLEGSKGKITCHAFSIWGDELEAMCIPFLDMDGNYWSEEEEVVIWELSAQILESPKIGKIMQNGMFDIMHLLTNMGIKTQHFIFDTMIAQHICWADLPKGLDYLVSIYTDHPYYKDEGKHGDPTGDIDGYWYYNAKDSAYTHECARALIEELEQLNAVPNMAFAMRLHEPLIEMQYNGLRVDVKGMLAYKDVLEENIAKAQLELNQLVDKKTKGKLTFLNTNSPKQCIGYFYVELGLTPYTNKKKMTTDDNAMKRLARRGIREAKLVQEIRSLRKLSGTYFLTENLGPDQRLRCEYKIAGTAFGRLASASPLFEPGTNLQNQPPVYKQFVIADEGKIMVDMDLSQAEARVVAYLSRDENMIKGFESGLDVHKYNASNIFAIPMDEVTGDQRQLGKKVVHASNYAMSYKTFSLQAEISEKEAKDLLAAYHARYPGLARWHADIRATVYAKRMLHTLYNRPKRFLEMLNDDTYRAAYACIPQGTIGELLNRIIEDFYEDPRFDDCSMHAQVHDSLLVQLDDNCERLIKYCMELKEIGTKSFTVYGRTFEIPCDFTIGYCWKKKGHSVEIKDVTPENIRLAYEELQNNVRASLQ